MTGVKRWTAAYHPLGSVAGPEVATMVLASDYDALMAELDTARANSHAWEDAANYHKERADALRAQLAKSCDDER